MLPARKARLDSSDTCKSLPSIIPILGVPVAQLNRPRAVGSIQELLAARRGGFVCVTGVHGVMEAQRDAAIMEAHRRAALVVPDGMPLVWVSRLRGNRKTGRVYGPDLVLDCCKALSARHFFMGGGEGVADKLAASLKSRFPDLDVAGTYTPPFGAFDPAEEERQASAIRGAEAGIVWVGLSTPRQELWMHRMAATLAPAVLVGVGAAFDFLPGLKRQAPPWIGNAGLEWLFRLFMEPRRLAGRYLVNNPAFLWRLAVESVTRR